MTGPFETERQALDLPTVRAVYDRFAAAPGVGRMAPHSRQMLQDACAAAGVSLGAYDRRILDWLAGFEPQMCAVVCGLISRAGQAGEAARPVTILPASDQNCLADMLADAVAYRTARLAADCADCATDLGRVL